MRDLLATEVNAAADSGPTEDEIRQRAHQIYLSRNGAPGSAELDWLHTEIELRVRRERARSG